MLTAWDADNDDACMFRLLALTALLFFALTLSAQNAPPHVRGRITDSSGAVIAGSKITILRGSEVIAELASPISPAILIWSLRPAIISSKLMQRTLIRSGKTFASRLAWRLCRSA